MLRHLKHALHASQSRCAKQPPSAVALPLTAAHASLYALRTAVLFICLLSQNHYTANSSLSTLPYGQRFGCG